MSVADARARRLAPRSSVVVRANGREARACVRPVKEMPRGMAAISPAFPETRGLFPQTEFAGMTEWMWSKAEVTPESEP